ncbi:MAG: radical SAM protein [Candidatus Korarchaeota archaeon]|nr:radical SAM protein [Thermoproteota archaeon]
MSPRYVYGPVLFKYIAGSTIGINNVPVNVCPYACVYCRFGGPKRISIERRPYSDPKKVLEEAKRILPASEADKIIFFASGEPVLDSNIRHLAEALRAVFGKPVGAVINPSLLWRRDVINDLLALDFLILRVDTVVEDTWKLINRPCKDLLFDAVLQGIRDFSKSFGGTIMVETVLIKNVNTSEDELHALGSFLKSLNPSAVFISPPYTFEKWVQKPTRSDFELSQSILLSELKGSNIIVSDKPDIIESFAVLEGNAIDILLSLLSVHPLRREQCEVLLRTEYDKPHEVLRSLLNRGQIRAIRYDGETLFLI